VRDGEGILTVDDLFEAALDFEFLQAARHIRETRVAARSAHGFWYVMPELRRLRWWL
jgi:hypothetical protein